MTMLTKPDHAPRRIATEAVKEAGLQLEAGIAAVNEVDDELEYTSICELAGLDFRHLRIHHPVVFAQVLMQNLGGATEGPDSLFDDSKLFWAKVASELGPDWINKFRRIGAFMSAVDKG